MTVDLDHLVLVDWLEDVGRIEEQGKGAKGSDAAEEAQLQSVDDHGNVLPVFANLSLKRENRNGISLLNFDSIFGR